MKSVALSSHFVSGRAAVAAKSDFLVASGEARAKFIAMKASTLFLGALAGAVITFSPGPARCADTVSTLTAADISVRNEVQHAIDQGLDWLAAHQATNGSWSTPEYPAITGLALSAFMGDPSGSAKARHAAPVQNGYKFILAQVKPDGGIYATNLQNYNTAICMMALVNAANPQYDSILRKARQWVIGQQNVLPGPFQGGIAYGNGPTNKADLSNTLIALEALYYTKNLDRDTPAADKKDLNWPAVIGFIQNCQNLPSVNQNASTNADDVGGFIYSPSESKAGAQTNEEGRIALRSYGTISYAGLLSYIYADLKKDDPRVSAVYDWLRNNYTLEENPSMAQQGYYYYLHLMSKAMNVYGVSTIDTKKGQVTWPRQVALKLINLQKTDGSWINANNRWRENDPALITAYSVMALEFAYHRMQ